uniref:Copia protein n=1 Tax=Cajanus cajan TaxID=3821 RepID=A0A151UFD3_CAJCA
MSLALCFTKSDNYRLIGYSDSDWCGDVDDRKSTAGYVFFMGNTAFTWLSKKQPIVALSTCEAEYVVASWNNRSAIKLAKNPINHERSKHIDVRFHFIREKVKEGSVELEHVGSKEQVADIFTKPLPATTFQELRKLLGMKEEGEI